jgi:hypothetical protein
MSYKCQNVLIGLIEQLPTVLQRYWNLNTKEIMIILLRLNVPSSMYIQTSLQKEH